MSLGSIRYDVLFDYGKHLKDDRAKAIVNKYHERLIGSINDLITCRAKLLKCDWLMRRAFFLNSGQKLLDPDWLRRFILSIRTKYQKYTQ